MPTPSRKSDSSATPPRQLLALGGGGFSFQSDDGLIDEFALGLCRQAKPRVCFVPTASGDADSELDAFYDAFPAGRAQTSHLSVFRRGRTRADQLLREADLIYIGGGNTANLLALWRLHGIDQFVREAYRAGTVLVGVSAGACCLFEGCLTDSFGLPLVAMRDGLALIEGSFCPHYNSRKRRGPYRQNIGEGFPPGFGVEDGAAIHFVDESLAQVVASQPGAGAYRVSGGDDRSEEPLPVHLLETV